MTHLRTLSLAALFLAASPLALSGQGNPSGPSMPQSMPQPTPQPPRPPQRLHMERGPEGPESGMMHILPPGMWWKDPQVVSQLGLTQDQVKKMDDAFLQFRIQLIHMHASLEEEQVKLEPVLNTNPLDQSKALAQISRIADLRADLEKTNARMLLGLRADLSAEQWTKLQAMGPRRGMMMRGRGPGGGFDRGSRRGDDYTGRDGRSSGRKSMPPPDGGNGQPMQPPPPSME